MSDKPKLHRNIKVVLVNCFFAVKYKTRKIFAKQNANPAMLKSAARGTKVTKVNWLSVCVLVVLLRRLVLSIMEFRFLPTRSKIFLESR